MTEEEIAQRVAKGLEFHQRNFNCAQCVACATCDLADMDFETTFLLMEAMGKGMGDTTQVCGAVSAACAIVGASMSNGSELCNTKARVYVETSQMRMAFSDRFVSSTCEDIRPGENNHVPHTCNDYIAAMTEMVCRKIG